MGANCWFAKYASDYGDLHMRAIHRHRLEAALSERGLELRRDSWLCEGYIARSPQVGSLNDVVSGVEVMAFLFRNTEYVKWRDGRIGGRTGAVAGFAGHGIRCVQRLDTGHVDVRKKVKLDDDYTANSRTNIRVPYTESGIRRNAHHRKQGAHPTVIKNQARTGAPREYYRTTVSRKHSGTQHCRVDTDRQEIQGLGMQGRQKVSPDARCARTAP